MYLNFDDASRAQICKDYNALSYERQKDMLLHVAKCCKVVGKEKGQVNVEEKIVVIVTFS
jgi:hypothetical protein